MILLFGLATAAANAAVVHLVEESASRYRIEAEAFADIASIDLTLEYIPGSRTISSVTQGALLQGMMLVSNLSQLGVARIGAVGTQTVNGDGTLAVLEISSGKEPFRVVKFTAKLNAPGGAELAATTRISLQADLVEADTESGTDSSGYYFGGTLNGLSSATEKKESNQYQKAVVESSVSSARRAAPLRLTFDDLRIYASASPIKKVREYRGPRTFAAMSRLFARLDDSISQAPYPALSDGDTEVVFTLPALTREMPDMALSDAQLIESNSDDGIWSIHCLPTRNTFSAQLLVLGQDAVVEVPLVVAPEINLRDFPLNEDGSIPEYDVTRNGVHDWQDDYIWLVNYQVNKVGE